MRRSRLRSSALAFLAVAAWAPAPPAAADPCPDVEVIFARGTDEPPGIGRMGQPFVDDLRADVGPRTVGVYAVNYPAITDWITTPEGANDTAARVREMMANCPSTKLILGGYSQGAAVISLATDGRLPPDAATHIVALALFGMPSAEYVNSHGSPAIAMSQSYLAKTINLCVPEDPVCAPGGIDGMAHGSYAANGMVAQAADFVAQQMG